MTQENNDMSRLDDALRKALWREDAPDGFADRVLDRVAQQDHVQPKVERRFSFRGLFHPWVRWAAFAAVSICLVIGGIHYRNLRRERAEGEAAKQQLMLALRIAGSKLQLARAKVNEINTPRPEAQPATTGSRSRS